MRTLSPLLPVLLLCACGPTADLDLSLDQSPEIPTVFTATVEGTASGIDEAWVEFGLDGDYSHTAPLDISSDPPWEVALLGMKPLSDYDVRVSVAVEEESYAGRAHVASTGGVPAELPDLTLERSGEGGFSGYLVTSLPGQRTAAVILDQDGEYVWWYQPEDFAEVGLGRTMLSRDGGTMLTMELNPDGREEGHLARIALDGSAAELTDADGSHHDLYEHADGTIAYLASDPVEIDGVEVNGAMILERAPDGGEEIVWDIWDHEDVLPFSAPQDGRADAWPHANALDYLPDEDAYLVGFLFLNAIARVDRATGAVDWVMGGANSDFALPDGGIDLFDRTHQMDWLDDSLLVFVNGAQQGGESYAVEYALDEEGMQVESVWEYHPDPSLTCVSLGDVRRLDSGDTLVTFSYSGEIHEVSPDGDVVWRLSSSVGGVFGYVTPVEDLYAAFDD